MVCHPNDRRLLYRPRVQSLERPALTFPKVFYQLGLERRIRCHTCQYQGQVEWWHYEFEMVNWCRCDAGLHQLLTNIKFRC